MCLNSRCDFENGFFTCDLPEDTVLLILKVKTQTGNHTLVEDTEKWTEKFWPWKKLIKDGKQVPQKLPGVLTPWKNDNSITSDSGPCHSPTEHKYEPRFFDEPDCMSSDKENIPPTESITPPSLKNLSMEEEADDNENEVTSWKASVARNLMTTPRASCPYLKQTSTLNDLEPDTDDDIIDIIDYSERPANDKRSPRPKQTTTTHTMTQGHCPTPQNSPTYLPMNAVAAAPPKPHRTEIRGILLDKRKVPCGWPACLRRQPPRVAFKNNDIYMVNDEEVNSCEELRERHPKVWYKLKICSYPISKNMPHKEEYDNDNYESIDETAV